jgi:hypothetical protein
MWWARHVTGMGEMRDEYKIFVVKPKGKRPFRRSRHRWEDNIKMDLRDIGWEGVDSSGSGQGQVSDCCECGNEPLGSVKGGESLD